MIYKRIPGGIEIVRLFVAIDLSPPIKEDMREAQAAVKATRAKVTLVDPSLIHITLKFLGEVPESRVAEVCGALREIKMDPFTISVNGISVNNSRNPRVVWGVIGDRGECGSLFTRIESALSAIGFPRETRPFTPHATIARIKVPDPGLLPAIRPFGTKTFGECRINGFSLKKSTLTPQGPVYENVLEVTW